MIVANFEEKYKHKFSDKNSVRETAKKMLKSEEIKCPVCIGKLGFHGTYHRHYDDDEGICHKGYVAQCRCRRCKIYPSLIPAFLMPYKHYEGAVIETELARQEGGAPPKTDLLSVSCVADDSTIRRWRQQFAERGGRACGVMASLLLEYWNRTLSLVAMHGLTLLMRLKILLREFPALMDPPLVIGGVNNVITAYNRGFI